MYKTPRETLRELRIQISLIFCAFFILLLLGAVVFTIFEDWTFLESLHFATISLTGRGFSSEVPTHWFSVVFSVFYLILGVGILIAGLSSAIAFYTSYYQAKLSKKVNDIWENMQTAKAKKQKEDKWVTWIGKR